MSETLLLRLPEGAQPARWLRVDALGNRIGHVQQGTLEEAAVLAKGRRLSVLMPGTRVSLFTVNVPVRNAQKALQAVPFALEDKLAEDVETLHFALGTRRTDGYPVAVTTRAAVQEYLRILGDAGLTPAELIPDMLALPPRPEQLLLVQEDARVLARFADGHALCTDAALAPLLIEKYLASLPEAQRTLKTLVHASESTDTQILETALSALQLPVTRELLPDGALMLMAAGYRERAFINLLQGEFNRQGGYQEQWRRWRPAALLAAACVVLILVQQGVSYFSMRHALHTLNTQIQSLFVTAMPDMQRVSDPNVMQIVMQRRLTALGGGGNSGPLSLLADAGGTLQQQNGIQLTGFSFHAGVLQLQVQAPTADALNALKTALSQQNASLRVSLDTVNNSGGQATGQLSLQENGS